MRELTEISLGGIVVGFRGGYFFAQREQSDKDALPVYFEPHLQSVFSVVETYPSIAARVVLVSSVISGLFFLAGYSEIAVRIIQYVVVLVIALAWISEIETKNKTMHVYHGTRRMFRFSRPADRIKRFHTLTPQCAPLPLRQVFKAMWANLRKLASRERDKAVCLVWGCHVGITSDVAMAGCSNIRQPRLYHFGVR